tara:strand:+ start:1162 stop:1389 length:228 start_codon:yes stop_codon:yes gene_type:complete
MSRQFWHDSNYFNHLPIKIAENKELTELSSEEEFIESDLKNHFPFLSYTLNIFNSQTLGYTSINLSIPDIPPEVY